MWWRRIGSYPEIGGLPELPRYAHQIVLRNLGPFRAMFIALTVIAVLSTCLKFVSVVVLGEIVTDIERLAWSEIARWHLPICITTIFCAEIIDYYTRRYAEAFPAVYADYMQVRLLRTILGWNSHRLTNISKERIGALVSKYVGHIASFLYAWVWGIVRHGTQLLIVLGILYYQSPLVAAIAILYMTVFLAISFGISSRFASYAHDLTVKTIDLGTATSSFLLNVNLLRRLQLTRFMIDRLGKLQDSKWLSLDRQQAFHARRWLFQLNLFNVMYLGTLFFGVYQVKQGTLSLGFIVLIKYAMDKLWDILVFMIEHFVILVQQREDSKIVVAGLRELAPRVGETAESFKLKQWQEIQLRNVHIEFLGKNEDTFTLAIPEFTVRRGEKIGILGPSGVGKSTFLNLLLNQIPFSGHYSIDQSAVDSGRTVIEGISIVTAHDPLFKLTLRDNILLGREVDSDRLAIVTRGVLVDEFCSSLDITVGAADFHLSAGQEQRVRLARTLVDPGELLLLDEPFNGLDRVTKNQVIDFLLADQAQQTIILVTHNPEELRLTKKNYKIEKGVLVGE